MSLDDLQCGQVVARPLTDETGRVLLNRGVKLTETYIRALQAKGYSQLFVREEDEIDIECEEDLSVALRAFAMQSLRQAYEDIEKELNLLKHASATDIAAVCSTDRVKALMGSGGPLANIQDLVSQILDEVLTRTTLAGLTSIKSQNSKMYDHSLDVCVIAIMIGQTINLSNVRLRQLAAGCLLHDIGMLFINSEMDERVRLRQHSLLGYELLKSGENPDIMAPHVAYEHHECQDGSGQPRGLKGSNRIERIRKGDAPVPTLIGEIAAVANTYDNLVSGKGGRPGLSPDVALTEMHKITGTVLNAEVVSAFRRVIPIFPRGTQVLLRGNPYNNFTAVVSKVDPAHFERPSVIVVRDANRQRVTPFQIDLQELPEVFIRSAIV